MGFCDGYWFVLAFSLPLDVVSYAYELSDAIDHCEVATEVFLSFNLMT